MNHGAGMRLIEGSLRRGSDPALAVAVLFARKRTVYRDCPGCDVWDIERDARNYAGQLPVICHPPCRAWGKLRHNAKPRPDEMELTRFAVAEVRRVGGVLEHPAYSQLWKDQGLPLPGDFDDYAGFTFPVHQSWFGHRSHKATWLYIVGICPGDLPPLPFRLVSNDCVPVENLGRAEREATPPQFAGWLVELALSCRRK